MSSTPAVLLNRDHPALVRFRHTEKTIVGLRDRLSTVWREALFGPDGWQEQTQAEADAEHDAWFAKPRAERRAIELAELEAQLAAEAAIEVAQTQWLAQHDRCTAAIEALYARTLSAVAAALVADLEAHLALVAGLEHDDDPPPPLHRSPIRTCHATTGPPRQDRRCISTELGHGRLVATQGRQRAT